MDAINTFFADLGNKMPFAPDFFAKNLKMGSVEINTLFMLLVAAVIVLIALVVIIVCACVAAKAKKAAKAKQNAPAEEASQAEKETVTEEAKAEETAEDVPAEEAKLEEPAAAEEEPVVEEKVEPAVEPVAEEPQVEVQEAVAAEEVPAQESKEEEPAQEEVQEAKAAPAKKGPVGTFEVSLCIDGYRFCLYANNKQLMYESVGFTSSDGAMKGIETFRKTLQEYPYVITQDKYGHYRYVFNKRYQGENYSAAAQAQSAAESVKRWAENAKVILRNPKPEEKEAYKNAVDAMRTKDDVNWDEVAANEANERKMGKFTVEEAGNQDEVIGYRFYLIANNAQILYTSAIYTTAAGALKAIDTFKRAVYIGNFYLDEDKFGRFRYILRASTTTTYVGESYSTRASAESSIESVKKFVKCASIIPFKKEAE